MKSSIYCDAVHETDILGYGTILISTAIHARLQHQIFRGHGVHLHATINIKKMSISLLELWNSVGDEGELVSLHC